MRQKPGAGLLAAFLAVIGLGLAPSTGQEPAAAPASDPPKYRIIKTVTVSPDETYINGAFCRVNRLPSAENLLVTFSTGRYGPPLDPPDLAHPQGVVFKEYTPDLEYAGRGGYFFMGGGDMASVVVGESYYLLTGGPPDLRIFQFDIRTWQVVRQTGFALDRPREGSGDQMLAWVNGRLDASSLYDDQSDAPSPYDGEATWHRFFTPDLMFLGRRVLADVPHQNGSSMIFLDGVHHLITSTAFFGDLIVLKYDSDWNFLGSKILVPNGQWPQGVAYDPDSETFIVAYLDISVRGTPNAALAIFSKTWDLVAGLPITEFKPGDRTTAGRPSVLLDSNRLYVSYDVDTLDASGESSFLWKARVSLLEPFVKKTGRIRR